MRGAAAKEQTARLRILQLNDVYCLETLPRFATAVHELGRDCTTVSVLAGDFVAPSMLSCLDSGRAAIDVLNACNLDYVCFGNHEADIPHSELLRRIEESRFKWINSNMTGFDVSGSSLSDSAESKLPRYEVLHTACGTRSAALLGMNTPDPGLYTGQSFGGATIHPIIPATQALVAELRGSVDAVIPMTHQSIEEDRDLARAVGAGGGGAVPALIGGHDHEEYHERVNGTCITKVGENAVKVGVIDIVWGGGACAGPSVHAEFIEMRRFEEDASVRAVLNSHLAVLNEVDRAVLFTVPRPLASVKVREMQTTLASFLLSKIRDDLSAECALVNAGAIRGSGIYNVGYGFTFGDLKREMPFNTFVVPIDLRGSVILDAVHESRCALPGGVCGGKFLQACDAFTFCPEDHKRVTHIRGCRIDPARVYRTVVHYHALMHRMDGIKSLYTVGESMQHKPPITIARPAKELVLSRFAPDIEMSLQLP